MKIGILTFHRAHNYGAVLQCYALQEILKKMGNDVYIVDYRQNYIEKIYKFFRIKRLFSILFRCGDIKGALYYVMQTRKRYKRRYYFDYFTSKFLKLTKPVHDINKFPEFDHIVIGSDQVWNPAATGGYDPVFYGDVDYLRNKVSGYAISSNLQVLCSLDHTKLKEICANFRNLSFREKNIRDYIYNKTLNQYSVTLDPTLLTTGEFWNPILNDKWCGKKYVLLYQVRVLPDNKEALTKIASSFAKHEGIELIDMSGCVYSVSDFLSLIKNASYIITSSFHATVFSILFRRLFNSYLLEDGGDERYLSLLKSLGLETCARKINQEPLFNEIDFDNVEIKQKDLCAHSIEFLNKVIKS